ncbi:3-keto-5-aminohexanoate cleavage protein [Photobacterium sp. DNB23_23_1]|uniref:3-keto-5-aminohexanoate cleavage protein n=1 Tax=Photobacterium pectinilyticum TaxID=2906793 RepID=A0ABT1N807_9GAMM|nr:3-keto-5-aminohexanoate cleavage protein [Photobacterium sp. ZSDE20]MCQ1059801.1 3-keto-5-aminohexanoate cleavage protein [Photobacterium sp. ZSDE20]MDD1826142.1 3-keto-5-aminohexanoate cleavage protein [Photobacterium sp. ZSDE20]
MENRLSIGQTAIIVAPNGARKTKADHPALPISHQEIIDEVIACRDAGAAMVHLHARDNSGKHSLEIEDNLLLYHALKERVGSSIIVQLTTEAVGQYSPEQQMALINEVKPEAASFALSELIPDNSYLDKASTFFHTTAAQGCIAQYILYSPDDLARYFVLLEQGILPQDNHHILLVLGRYDKHQTATPQDLSPFMQQRLFYHNKRWALCAFGKYEHLCLTGSMIMGGDIRVGFENNHVNHQGTLASSNAQQVAKLADTAKQLGLATLDADRFRQLLTA